MTIFALIVGALTVWLMRLSRKRKAMLAYRNRLAFVTNDQLHRLNEWAEGGDQEARRTIIDVCAYRAERNK